MTLKPPEAEFPFASVAVQLTGVVPIAKVVPLAGVQLGTIVPSTMSEALAE
jgi:hypothetical protein